MAFRGNYGLQKQDREANRAARRIEKQQRLAARRAEKAAIKQFDNGVFPIADLPPDVAGVFRTLSRKAD